MKSAPALLDPFIIVDEMTADQRRHLAAIAVALSVSIDIEEYGHGDAPQGFEAGQESSFQALADAMADYLPANLRDGRKPIELNKLGTRMCTGCGCTDQLACAGGCHWIGPTTCSSCGTPATVPAGG